MSDRITKHTLPYPVGSEPNYIIPQEYCDYRYAIGRLDNSNKLHKNPLVAICMNPSAASDELSDCTINRIIKVSKELSMDGWVVFNTYPERATNADELGEYDEAKSNENINIIRNFLLENKITEVWAAWGDDNGYEPLIKGREHLISMLKSIGVKIYYYGTLTKSGNPRHPLQRVEKCNFTSGNKHYL